MLLCTAGILAEQFADGPRLQLYNAAEKHWQDLMNWQHSTMYLFFGLAGIVCLVVHTTDVAPLALDRLMLAIAFFNQGEKHTLPAHSSDLLRCKFVLPTLPGFLFLYHLHGRTMLDVHVHQLLLYAVFGSAAVAFLEVFHRGNILMEMLRCVFTMLQGSWFWQVNLKHKHLKVPSAV